jgi:hypothetical protein
VSDDRLVELAAKYKYDPYGWVLAAYDWGHGELANAEGPDVWQEEYLKDFGRELERAEREGTAVQMGVASGHGIGKAQPKSLKLHTPLGLRRWGDLKAGDYVFGSDGAPTKILKTHEQGVKDIYRVAFDDGSSTLVCREHLWAVRGRQERRKKVDGWRVMDTEAILKAGVKRKNGKAVARQWEIPRQGAAQFPSRMTNLHPYLMGVWLGDGSKGQPNYGKPVPEIANRIRACGYDVSLHSDGISHRILGVKWLFDREPVTQLGSHKRYIPDDYKLNDVEARKELLRGLLDTDGEVHGSGSVGYSTTSKQLAEDVIWLARSLGAKAMMHPTVKKPFYTNNDGDRVDCRDCYRVTINMDWNPFTHPDKRDRWKPSEDRYMSRWIESIEFSHREDAMCITVEAEDSLYLCNDFIVTHNTALVTWCVQFYMVTRPKCLIRVTANTERQLKHTTWRELAKWHKLSLWNSWFKWERETFRSVEHPETWYAVAIPWSENNSEAFAGQHEGNTMTIFDEASGIAPIIWEVATGAMTTHGAVHLCFGNPTQPSGGFYNIFHKARLKDTWNLRHIDARTAKQVRTEWAQELVDIYGLESDYVRRRVLGQFPRQATAQLIPGDIVEAAQERRIPMDEVESLPLLMGVDVARFGDDHTCFVWRKGKKVIDWEVHKSRDVIDVARMVAAHLERRPAKCFVDANGMGAGVVDALSRFGFDPIAVSTQRKATKPRVYYNLRIELWDAMKVWLETADIPNEERIREQLVGPEYMFDKATSRMILERKEDMKKRGLESPDFADSLAMTFVIPGLESPLDPYEDDYTSMLRGDHEDARDMVTGY